MKYKSPYCIFTFFHCCIIEVLLFLGAGVFGQRYPVSGSLVAAPSNCLPISYVLLEILVNHVLQNKNLRDYFGKKYITTTANQFNEGDIGFAQELISKNKY